MLDLPPDEEAARLLDRSAYRGFPAFPPDAGPVALHLYVWLYLAVLPRTLRYHAERGIARHRSWEKLSGLGPMMAEHRSMHGVGGVGAFDQWCPPLKFRGTEYRLGRLEYDRGQDDTTGFVLHLHIPPGAPLSPASCDASFGQARRFFGRHFPEEPVSYVVCHSWLLDPQLTEYLPERSNIVRFLRRFVLEPVTPGDEDRADASMLEYLFGRPGRGPVTESLLADLPQDTTLRRAYVTHLRSGRTGTPAPAGSFTACPAERVSSACPPPRGSPRAAGRTPPVRHARRRCR